MSGGMATYAPVSSGILSRLVDEVEEGGPVAQALAEHPDAGAPLFCMRALSGVRWLVLSGLAPDLEAHLRNLTSGIGDPTYVEQTWLLFRDAMLKNPGEIRAALDRPIQQHQPGRAAALLSGLGMLGAPRVRLLELGACAGLNLLVDRYRWFGPDWEWGDADSPVRLATDGRNPGDIRIVERAGCDLVPRDPADPADSLIVRSFLPPERDIEQLELDDALTLASRFGVQVDKADAVEWLEAKLSAVEEDRSIYTVVWHSLFWSYLDPQQQTQIERLLSRAACKRKVARVSFEPHEWETAPRLQITVYS